ncbi:hypothetical protein C8R45DRAFT_1157642 [Mycena sanguinolenta]|nr:hypothetical protein C8R45DRAFT_1157642 [Mycena sanguinolenta]
MTSLITTHTNKPGYYGKGTVEVAPPTSSNQALRAASPSTATRSPPRLLPASRPHTISSSTARDARKYFELSGYKWISYVELRRRSSWADAHLATRYLHARVIHNDATSRVSVSLDLTMARTWTRVHACWSSGCWLEAQDTDTAPFDFALFFSSCFGPFVSPAFASLFARRMHGHEHGAIEEAAPRVVSSVRRCVAFVQEGPSRGRCYVGMRLARSSTESAVVAL